jgi:bifunctional DNase/RNase
MKPFVLIGGMLAASAVFAAPPDTKPAASDKASENKGFIEMFVAGVVPSPDGHTLVLVNPDEQVLLPLGIGLTEALSIHGRLEKRAFARPMTHDLLDHIVHELGGEIVRVQIDDLRDDVFVGTVFIKTAGKVIQFDARPSDAVALALGSRVPIYVARPVVDRAAIHPGDLEDTPPASTPAPPPPGVLAL